ncbi:MAG: Na(+)-translocating NADH-quinone reductase subunit A [Proteobacteria bacterium]|nr:Na(+)-translocating NADH-quinone reductase subunit A [Pseudomonadota bacterium]
MHITRGLDIPILGQPKPEIDLAPDPQHVAVLGCDFHGLKPTMLVEKGTQVRRGAPLFEDKKNPGVIHTAPASGVVIDIHRGEKRRFLSCVIKVDIEQNRQDQKTPLFEPYPAENLLLNSHEKLVKERVVKSGLWPAFRTRPFSKTPSLDARPEAVFVSTHDSQPLAMNPGLIIDLHSHAFYVGLKVIHALTRRNIFLNKGENQNIPGDDLEFVTTEVWSGKHPSGLVGTHMHYLKPVNIDQVNWHIGYQDVVALGYLFDQGILWHTRYVALSGPASNQPRVLQTCQGASLDDILPNKEFKQQNPESESPKTDIRVISGSVLGGRTSQVPVNFLSRWSYQVTLIHEGKTRDFFLTKGWLSPGFHKFSVLGTYLGKFIPGYLFPMTTNTQGSRRSMVPIGLYEKVMPLDILGTYLLRALIAKDTERAQALGVLELDEADLALATFVCPGKYEYGPILRENLELIEKNG